MFSKIFLALIIIFGIYCGIDLEQRGVERGPTSGAVLIPAAVEKVSQAVTTTDSEAGETSNIFVDIISGYVTVWLFPFDMMVDDKTGEWDFVGIGIGVMILFILIKLHHAFFCLFTGREFVGPYGRNSIMGDQTYSGKSLGQELDDISKNLKELNSGK